MPVRDLPTDDLYARLELPAGAAPEAIEIAWRALLKRHHPDVAGESSLEVAKNLNVAHDWLSDPELRARYDRERNVGRRTTLGARTRSATKPRGSTPGQSSVRARRPWSSRPADARTRADLRFRARRLRGPREQRPPDLDLSSAAVQAFLDKVAGLNSDELDRLALAEPPPIAFVASIRRFLTADRQAAIDAVEVAVAARLPAAAQGRSRIGDAVTSVADLLVLEGFLADSLSDPFRERVGERMMRGWEAAVGQRRYGPNTPEVEALVARAGRLGDDGARRIAEAAREARLGAVRWPPGTDPAEDEVLRISVDLAGHDAAAAVAACGLSKTRDTAARNVMAVLAGIIALRPAYAPAAFASLTSRFAALGLVTARPHVRR
jgi:curved DNA-binding protein CbpA